MIARWLVIFVVVLAAFAALWLGARSAQPAEATSGEPIVVDVKRRTTDMRTDPSNRDSNKGFVNNTYDVYEAHPDAINGAVSDRWSQIERNTQA